MLYRKPFLAEKQHWQEEKTYLNGRNLEQYQASRGDPPADGRLGITHNHVKYFLLKFVTTGFIIMDPFMHLG